MGDMVKGTAYAPVLLRGGIVGLFLWFGLSQVTNPGEWIAWIPTWALSLPIAPKTIVLMNGGFETVFGIALAAGYWTRIAALLLALHLFFIAYEIGYNDIGVRDFVLAICTLTLALFEPDRFTLDARSHASLVSQPTS